MVGRVKGCKTLSNDMLEKWIKAFWLESMDVRSGRIGRIIYRAFI